MRHLLDALAALGFIALAYLFAVLLLSL